MLVGMCFEILGVGSFRGSWIYCQKKSAFHGFSDSFRGSWIIFLKLVYTGIR